MGKTVGKIAGKIIKNTTWINGIASISLATSMSVAAQQDFSQVEYSKVPVLDNLIMLQGAGGNIALSTGADGMLIIDDDYEGMGAKLLASLSEYNETGPQFLLNTHWHSDHSGNNQAIGRQGAIIVAHDNARDRLQKGGEVKAFNMVVPPADPSALPVVTYDESMFLYWNGWKMELEHPDPAHTDGDTVVYFYQDNQLKAVHTGDLFFNGFYPFIDASSGGSAEGMVEGVEDILESINDETKVIPGHGPLATKADLQAYHDFMEKAVDRIKSLKKQGKSVEEIVAAKPLAEFEEEWGDGFLSTEQWIGIVYGSL